MSFSVDSSLRKELSTAKTESASFESSYDSLQTDKEIINFYISIDAIDGIVVEKKGHRFSRKKDSDNIPVFALLSYPKKSGSSIRTKIPSLPLTESSESTSLGRRKRYSAHFTLGENEKYTFKMGMPMRKIKNKRREQYEPKAIDLRISLMRGKEIIDIGFTSVVFDGKERGQQKLMPVLQNRLKNLPLSMKSNTQITAIHKKSKAKALSFADEPTKLYWFNRSHVRISVTARISNDNLSLDSIPHGASSLSGSISSCGISYDDNVCRISGLIGGPDSLAGEETNISEGHHLKRITRGISQFEPLKTFSFSSAQSERSEDIPMIYDRFNAVTNSKDSLLTSSLSYSSSGSESDESRSEFQNNYSKFRITASEENSDSEEDEDDSNGSLGSESSINSGFDETDAASTTDESSFHSDDGTFLKYLNGDSDDTEKKSETSINLDEVSLSTNLFDSAESP